MRQQGSGEDYITRNFMLSTPILTIYYLGDQIKKTKMSRVCSMYGVEKRCVEGFGGQN